MRVHAHLKLASDTSRAFRRRTSRALFLSHDTHFDLATKSSLATSSASPPTVYRITPRRSRRKTVAVSFKRESGNVVVTSTVIIGGDDKEIQKNAEERERERTERPREGGRVPRSLLFRHDLERSLVSGKGERKETGSALSEKVEERNFISGYMRRVQSGPAERPMRTDYNCKRSLVGEVSEEAPPASLGDSRHWHGYTRATTCRHTPRGTSGPPRSLPPNQFLLQNRFHLLSRAPNVLRICRPADYPAEIPSDRKGAFLGERDVRRSASNTASSYVSNPTSSRGSRILRNPHPATCNWLLLRCY